MFTGFKVCIMVDKEIVERDILNNNHHLISYSDQNVVPVYKEDQLLHDNDGYRSLLSWNDSNTVNMDTPGVLEDFNLDSLSRLVRCAIKKSDIKIENRKLIKSLLQPKKSCFSLSDHQLWFNYHDKLKNKDLSCKKDMKKLKRYDLINRSIYNEQELYRKYAKDHAKLNIHLYNYTSDYAAKYFDAWSKRAYNYTQSLFDKYIVYRVLCIDLFGNYTSAEFEYQNYLAEVKCPLKPFRLFNLDLNHKNCEHLEKLQSQPTKISEDCNIELILEKVEVDFIMSLSTLKHLLDLDENSTYEIPVIDKTFKLKSGKTQQCVIFEKVLPPKKTTSRFQMELYYKQLIKEQFKNNLKDQTNYSVNRLKRKITQVDGGDDSSSDESTVKKSGNILSDVNSLVNNSQYEPNNSYNLSSTKAESKKNSSPEFSFDSDDSDRLVIDECLTTLNKPASKEKQDVHDIDTLLQKDSYCPGDISTATVKREAVVYPKVNNVTKTCSPSSNNNMFSVEQLKKLSVIAPVKQTPENEVLYTEGSNIRSFNFSDVSSKSNKKINLSEKAKKDINNSMMMGIIDDNDTSTISPTEPSVPTDTELKLSDKSLKNNTYFYSLWKLGDKKILIRMKSHGKIFYGNDPDSNNVCVRSKLEYQHLNGYEMLTLFEQCSDWLDVLMQPKPLKIIRFRICPFKDKIVKTDEVESFTSTIKHNKHHFHPSKACHRLQIMLKKLSSELTEIRDKSQNDIMNYLIEKELKKAGTITLKLAQKSRPKDLKNSSLNNKTYKISDYYRKTISKVKSNEESFPYYKLDETNAMPGKPMQIPLTFDIDPNVEPFVSKTRVKSLK